MTLIDYLEEPHSGRRSVAKNANHGIPNAKFNYRRLKWKSSFELSKNFKPSFMKQILKKTRLTFGFGFLKHYYYIFSILAITVVPGCSKQNSTTTPPATTPANNPLTITVIEKNTNKPIAGATVSLQKCSNYDFVFGCIRYSTFTTLTTNTEGKVTYSGNTNIEQILVDANKYWNFYEKSRIQNVILIPKTIIEINVKREKTYASTDILWIGQNRYLDDLKPIGLPIDTTIYIDGLGYSENKIYWYINFFSGGIININSIGGSTPNFFVNGFDTARIQIKY
jgi:hypothetical protein